MHQTMPSPTSEDWSSSWVVHHAHALAASIRPISSKAVSVLIQVYSFGRVLNSEPGELVKCREYQLVTECICRPSILSFGLMSSGQEALLRPQLFIYDKALKILECHEIQLSGSSRIGRTSVALDVVQTLSVIPGPKLIAISRGENLQNAYEFDLLEWSPLRKEVLHTRVEARAVLGIVGFESDDTWQLLYYPPGGKDFTLLSSRRSELFETLGPMQEHEVFDIRAAIPDIYLGNLRYIYASACLPSDIPAVHCVWVHTIGGELAFFKDGKLQWSKPLQGRVFKIELVMSTKGNMAYRSCLSVQTESSTRLYDSLSGKLLEEWSRSKSVVFADIWGYGSSVGVVLPTSNMDGCILYSTFPASLDASMPVTTTSPQNTSREKASLVRTQDVVGIQLQTWLQKSARLKSVLSNKRDTIRRCHISLSDDYQSTLSLGGPVSSVSHSANKRNLHRKHILKRMTPILGDAVQSSYMAVYPTSISFVESTAGWIVTGIQTYLWVCIEARNETEGALENLRLCAAGLSSRGHMVSTLGPRGSCNVFCVREMPDNRANMMAEFFLNRLQLHYEQPLAYGSSARYPCTLSTPRVVAIVQDVKPAWRAALADLILPHSVRHSFEHMSRDRLRRMIHDGLGLSSADNAVQCGSMEEGLLVAISGRDADDRTCTAYFHAGRESDAKSGARQAVQMSSAFCS